MGLTKVANLPGRGTGVTTQVPITQGKVVCNYAGSTKIFKSKTAVEKFINTLDNTDYTFTVSI